jgi:hypothetical protein
MSLWCPCSISTSLFLVEHGCMSRNVKVMNCDYENIAPRQGRKMGRRVIPALDLQVSSKNLSVRERNRIRTGATGTAGTAFHYRDTPFRGASYSCPFPSATISLSSNIWLPCHYSLIHGISRFMVAALQTSEEITIRIPTKLQINVR